MSDRIIRHLQTYAAHEKSLGGLCKLFALCRGHTVFVVEFALQAYLIRYTIIAVRGGTLARSELDLVANGRKRLRVEMLMCLNLKGLRVNVLKSLKWLRILKGLRVEVLGEEGREVLRIDDEM